MVSQVDIRHAFPWLEPGYLHAVDESALEPLRIRLRDLGFELTDMDGRAMAAGRDAFFADLQLAFGFPDHFGRNWDAFHDCIGDFEPPAHLAIIWRASDEAARANPALFGEACAELSRFIEASQAQSAQVAVFLVGVGDSYQQPEAVRPR